MVIFPGIFAAVERGDVGAVRRWLDSGGDAGFQDAFGITLLHSLSRSENDNTEMAEMLIERGCSVKARDNFGMTALHYAARSGLVGVSQMLIKHGAEVDVKENKFGDTPLHCAVAYSRPSVVELLLGVGATSDALNRAGRTPVECANEAVRQVVDKSFSSAAFVSKRNHTDQVADSRTVPVNHKGWQPD